MIRADTSPHVDAYVARSGRWPDEMAALRPILLACGLDEQITWRSPCYSAGGKNIAIMQEMNDFLALTPEVQHVFQFGVGRMPETDAAVSKIGDDLGPRLGL